MFDLNCAMCLLGEVIFDRNHPTLPPDIIFSPQDELLEFDPDIDRLKVYACVCMLAELPEHFEICYRQV